MKDRRRTLLWMKDLIEHMNCCHEQLLWAADGPSESYLTESMLVDLNQCQRLCEMLRSESPSGRALVATA